MDGPQRFRPGRDGHRAVRVAGRDGRLPREPRHGRGPPPVPGPRRGGASGRESGTSLRPFGDNPSVGGALYLGFSRPLPIDRFATLYVSVDGVAASTTERARIRAELVRDPGCRPIELPCDCADDVVTAAE